MRPNEPIFTGAASYAKNILDGGRPSEIPVQQPTKFELVVNQITAKALSNLSETFLSQADKVIDKLPTHARAPMR